MSGHVNYKIPEVRVVLSHGRFAIESRLGDTWHPLALRERQDTANAIAASLRDLLRSHTDERFEREQRDRDATEAG